MSNALALPDRIDLTRAADLQATLVAELGAPLTLNAQAVVHISTPALQVLLAAAKTWRDNGHALAVEEPSPPFLKMLTLAGLTLDDVSSTPGEPST